ncbi:tight junction-associated protein 1-like [Fundulus heteroclitus]|uniref:tight junction-associated protein 1-like n=1 Tax=Fundulus heteroclitus TaxID=8078 RepID=UPI00165B325C|nr:tight junction-associated protein 1-like [Fundulus heteroclitus]
MNNYVVERTTPTSPQHGSPDSDKFFPGPYHPPFPSPTPESSSKLDSDSESLLTSLQRHTVYWSRPPGGVRLRPEFLFFSNKISGLPARLPAMPSLSETQEEDLQALNLPPTPEVSQDSQLPSGQGDPASPDPSQPEDTLLPSSQGETDTGADEYNGWEALRVHQSVAHNIHQDNHTVNAVVQAYLYELTMAKELFHTILDGYDEMVEENYELKDQLEAITQYWQGS